MSKAPNALPPIVLCFSASDPTGGAGMQADLLTLAALGCHALSAISAVTVQDTVGVSSVHPLDAECFAAQARAVLEDMPVAAFKVGLLGSAENVAALAAIVADYPHLPLVVDPVLASGRGDELTSGEIIDAMFELLLPQTTLLTPNALELRRLAEDDADADDPDQPTCAERLIDAGCEYVLATGTHENSTAVINTLYGRHGRVRNDRWQRLNDSYHGSGCTLAAAIAGGLAHGLPLESAVRAGQEYTWQTLAAGFRPGMGQHLPNRFFAACIERQQ